MTLQLEISNPQDAELILNLVRRLSIPFKQSQERPVAETERKESDTPLTDMAAAAVLLVQDYTYDDELTAFSVLDSADIHE